MPVVYNPSPQQLAGYSPSRQEDVEGALGEEEKEKKHCAKFGSIPWLEYFLLAAAQPAARVLGTCQLPQEQYILYLLVKYNTLHRIKVSLAA